MNIDDNQMAMIRPCSNFESTNANPYFLIIMKSFSLAIP